MSNFLELHGLSISGTIETFDRVIFKGHLNGFFPSGAFGRYLWRRNVLLKDAGQFFKAIDEYRQPDQSYSGNELFGIAVPVVLGVGLLILGVLLMLVWRVTAGARFFARRREVVDPDVAAGRRAGVAAVPEEAV